MAGYDSLYFGKVIRDSDIIGKDDTRPYNRVKVLIIGQSSAENENFQQPFGKNNPSTMSRQLLDVIDKELYAYVLLPVSGSGTGATYNAAKDLVSVSDTGDIEDLDGTPPAESYFDVSDSFIGGMGSSTAGVNPYATAYSPDNRSNAFKGMMSLPSVGTTVVVSFMNGVRGMPIIIGILPSAADVDSIHGLGLSEEIYPNYPFAYSNLTAPHEVVEELPVEAGVAPLSGGPASETPIDDDNLSSEDLKKDTIELIRQERGDAAAAAAEAELNRVSAEQAADRKAMWERAAAKGGGRYIPPDIKSQYGL